MVPVGTTPFHLEADSFCAIAFANEHATLTDPFGTATLDERRAWSMGFPIVVAADPGDGVLGFASFGEWRGVWPGYRYTVEHSVHVRADVRGRGIGRALVESLFPLALGQGKHVMIGGIDAANDASIRFHERRGFERVAHFREVGHKFGRWLDLVFMQRFLDPPGTIRS